jgi:cytochrome c peroxidase
MSSFHTLPRNRQTLGPLVSLLALATTQTVLLPACGPDPGALSVGGADAPMETALKPPLPGGALIMSKNKSGTAATFSQTGPLSEAARNPFFLSLGANGRTCASCHVLESNWGLSPAEVKTRFNKTQGLDPLFREVDGANAPDADVRTVGARRRAYSMLVSKGLIRVGLPVPPAGELELLSVDDPYRFASAQELSLFRRPLPTANLPFLTATMWDGRESSPVADALVGPNEGDKDLGHQANDATMGHAQATTGLTAADQQNIVRFELGLFSAQVEDDRAGDLTLGTRNGGATGLAVQGFYFGINDVVDGDSHTHAPFNPNVFALYDVWAAAGKKAELDARSAIRRGEVLFNTRAFQIADVRGLNDVLGVSSLRGTCSTCHDSPNLGHHSVRLPVDIGVTSAEHRTPDMPLYTFCKRRVAASGAAIPGTCDPSVSPIQTTDPGRSLVTGKWAHMNLFKGPILRGLAARAPYFHNGLAADLDDVVAFYDTRFGIGLTGREQADLVAFLQTL